MFHIEGKRDGRVVVLLLLLSIPFLPDIFSYALKKNDGIVSDRTNVRLIYTKGSLQLSRITTGRDRNGLQGDWIGEKPRLALFFFEPVPVNRADISLLQTVPGIGKHTAWRIRNFIEKNGPIANIAEFTRIEGIGKNKARKLAKHLSFQH